MCAGPLSDRRDWAEIAAGLDVALSLVEAPDGRPLYRLGLAQPKGAMPKGEHDHSANARARHR